MVQHCLGWMHNPALCQPGLTGSEKHLEGGPGLMLSCPVAGRASGIAPWVPLPNKTSPGWGHDARLQWCLVAHSPPRALQESWVLTQLLHTQLQLLD